MILYLLGLSDRALHPKIVDVSSHRRGNMRVYQTDYYLESAWLDIHESKMEDARKNVQAAAQLMQETGYKRRLQELEQLQALL